MDKIIQIMPAPENLYSVYAGEGEEETSRVLCLALTDMGYIYLMDIDMNGQIEKAQEMSNFMGIEWA